MIQIPNEIWSWIALLKQEERSMGINRTVGALLLSSAMVFGGSIQSFASDADDRRKAAAVAGVLIGAAALAAASKHHRHKNHRRHSKPVYSYGAPFSPRRNITCYPRERACYRRNGRFAGRATQRYFGG